MFVIAACGASCQQSPIEAFCIGGEETNVLFILTLFT